ncbi:M48 family metalloprotease [Thiotrichales bacterium 19S3-7]|nr:M48 family metalloprotease [Thiotrichales bacterium 19S3-7]MCF6802608.1 M48 family metalloprotease [Thiotrichales bacterium 19S3-11]
MKNHITKTCLIFLMIVLSLRQGVTDYALISTPKEKTLGNEILRQISYQTPIYRDLVWNAYLEKLGNYLVSYSSKPTTEIDFYIAKSDQINAFALPGNIIVINSALILKTDNEAQLAAVLSHEIAHVIQKHFQRMYEQYTQQLAINAAAVIASILVGGAISPEAAQAGVLGSMAATSQTLIGYTRAHEYEADRIGNQTLFRAGYPNSAMSEFLAHLPRSTYHKAIEPLLTHPVVEKRQAETITLNRLQGKDYIISSYQDYQLLKIKLAVSVTDNIQAELKLTKSNQNLTKLERYYKLGLLALLDKENTQAQNYLAKAWHGSNHNLIVGLAYLEALILSKSYPKAESIAAILKSQYPLSLALDFEYVDYLIASNQLDKARWCLYDLISHNPHQYRGYQKLALVYDQLGEVGLMHFYLSESYYYQGKFAYALSQLKLAKSYLPEASRYYKEAQVKEEKLKSLLLQ